LCQYQASVTAGTIFEGTRKPLTMWFRAIWWVCAQKNGASALGLQQILGLGSYKTAWTWLHKLRRAMVRQGRDRLSGRIEVDETFLGAVEEGHIGRQHGKKVMIIVAAQEDGRGIGRIRMKVIDGASQANLHGFIAESVVPGSTVITDGLKVYRNMDKLGYAHEYRVVMKSQQTASDLLPRVHRVVSLLKRWLMGTHQGAVSREHLGYYLDEFTFRFNRRTSRSRGKLFYRLLQQAVAIEPTPYEAMIKHIRGRKARNHTI
jgi:transposase-like protein